MKRFREKPNIVEAQQITDSDFDADHPNPDHVPGIIYSPVHRSASVEFGKSILFGFVGDWIIRSGTGLGTLSILPSWAFEECFEPVDDPSPATPKPEGGWRRWNG